MNSSWHPKPKRKKVKTLKQFTFDAGNSNKGPVGIVISVEAHTRHQATRLANAYLSSFADPIDLPVPPGYKGLGVRYAMCCVAPHLKSKDIDLDDITLVDPRDRNPDSQLLAGEQDNTRESGSPGLGRPGWRSGCPFGDPGRQRMIMPCCHA